MAVLAVAGALLALAAARPLAAVVPGLAVPLAVATIGVHGGSFWRGGLAAAAIAVATPLLVRTRDAVPVAAVGLAFGTAAVGLGEAVARTTGRDADLFALLAALGLGLAGLAGAKAVAVANLAALLALPSKGGLIAGGIVILALLARKRLDGVDASAAALAVAVAWLLGAPFARAALWHGSGGWHAAGVAGEALLGLALGASLVLGRRLPADAAEAERDAMLREEQRRLDLRRRALDEREAALARREGLPEAAVPAPAPEPLQPSEPLPEPPPPAPEPEPVPEPPPPLPPPEPEREPEPEPEPEREPEPEPEPVPEPPPPPPPPEPVPIQPTPTPAELQPVSGRYSIPALRQLVRAKAAEHPDRVEEWEIYLDTLEPYAEGGILPDSFEFTILDIFDEVLPRSFAF
jgi:hypothetical protein